MVNYITRVHALIRNCINQLSCLYHERQKLYLSTFRFIHLEYVFETMGELMRVLVTMDAIIAGEERMDMLHVVAYCGKLFTSCDML